MSSPFPSLRPSLRFVLAAALLGASGLLRAADRPAPAATAEAKLKLPATTPEDRRLVMGKLKKGLSETQIRKLLGAPDRVVPKETEAGKVDAWIYRSTFTAGTQHVQTGMNEYERPNPLTGVPEKIKEPVLGVETITVTEEHILVFRKGRLLEWTTVASRSTSTS